MLKIFIIIALIAITGFIIKNLSDRPLTQHLKNKDKKDQREHERIQSEKEREFWLEKNKIINKEKNDDFTRAFIVDYVKSSVLISEDQKAYVVQKLINEVLYNNSAVDRNLDEAIKKITNDIVE